MYGNLIVNNSSIGKLKPAMAGVSVTSILLNRERPILRVDACIADKIKYRTKVLLLLTIVKHKPTNSKQMH